MRGVYLISALLIAIVVGTAVFLFWPFEPPRPDLYVAYQRIHIGMSQAEVEKIVGFPPGNYSGDNNPFYSNHLEEGQIPEKKGDHLSWMTDRAMLDVVSLPTVSFAENP